jgi:hypothetical protein
MRSRTARSVGSRTVIRRDVRQELGVDLLGERRGVDAALGRGHREQRRIFRLEPDIVAGKPVDAADQAAGRERNTRPFG